MANKHINKKRLQREKLILERNIRNGTEAKFSVVFNEKGKRVLVKK